MKTAYEYIRISNEDQSNFSISGQQKMNREFADRNGITIVKTFIDDGVSAKDFNRPQWKALESDIFKNRSKVDFLIVMKYDRLIRNLIEGLSLIEKLEKQWGITFLSVMENFFIDPHSPYFFKMRVDLLVQAEMERREGQRRTRFGMWSAQTQGRFISRAPFGYDNSRDETNKPIITINEEEAPVIRELFSGYICGTPPVMLLKTAKEKGLKLTGHGTLHYIITNPVYGGFINVSTFQNEPAKLVKGIHEAIVPEHIFWKAYYKMLDASRSHIKIVDPNLPLRGMLLCGGCGVPYTGSKSKGRSAYYNYYRCLKCRSENHSAIKVHEDIHTILSGLSLSPEMIEAINTEIKYQVEEVLQEREQMIRKVNREYETVKNKLDQLEEKHITNKISEDVYRKWHPVYFKETQELKESLFSLKVTNEEKRELFRTTLPYFENIPAVYNTFDVEGKHDFLKGVFIGGLYKEKGTYRTGILNELFITNQLKINHMLTISNEKSPLKEGSVPESGPSWNQIEHLLRIVAKLVAVFLLLFSLSGTAQDNTLQPIPEPCKCKVDTLAIIKAYLNSTHGWIEQNKIPYMGDRAFVKQKGIFLGAGVGLRNYETHQMVIQNNKYVSVWRPASELLMYYISGQIVSGKNIFGMNLGNTTVSWQYTRHIN